MFLFSYSAVILSLLCLGIAAFIFHKKKTVCLAKYFSAYIVCVGFWIGSNALADFALTDFTVRLWSGISLITGAAYISFYLLFIEAFITESQVNRVKKILIFLPTLFFSSVAFTHFYVVDTYVTPGVPAQIIAGPIYYFVLAFTFGGLPYGLWKLFRAYHISSRQKKNQIFYLAAGFTTLLLGAIIFTVILPIALAEFRFYTLGPQFALFTIATTAYAMFKHRLLEIKVVLQLGLIYTILLMGLVILNVITLFLMLMVFQNHEPLPFLLSALVTTITGVFTGPFLDRKFRSLTDPFFFKDKYNFSEAIHELSDILGRHDRIEEIIRHATGSLKSILRTEIAIFSLIPEYSQYPNTLVPGLATLLKKISEGSDCVDQITQSVTEDFPMIQPLIVEDQCIGAILIGPKKSGEDYAHEDKRLIQTFTHQAGVAFKKALLYQQVIDYSQNLSQKVAERTEEIKNLHENQTQLMLDISHELQTPLTVIKGEFDRVRAHLPPNAAVGAFEKSIDRISSFIKAMLKLAKLEAAETTVKSRLNFSELINEVVEYVTVLASDQNINVQGKITPGLFVHGNREQLEQLITNLLSNALKYIANARKVMVDAHVAGNQVKLIITDTGTGIPKDQIGQLFQRFYRIPTETKQGTGLGLAICERIVKNHGGTIVIDSEPSEGTSVTVTLATAD